MSSAMRNFMGAYAAVHNSEAKEEYYSERDLVSEMNTATLTDNDLREIAEEVCEILFNEEMTLERVESIFSEVLVEGENVGRNKKLSRILGAFTETFNRIKSKANRLESFIEYRHAKKLQETWSARFNQDKRIQKHHSALVAEDRAGVKAGLLELYKGKHGQSEKEYQDSRSMAGKMVSGDSKGSGANYSYKAQNTGPNPAGGSKKPQGQARMSSNDRSYLAYQKANMKKKSMKESWADAYKSVYEAAKPDYLDFDKDGNEKESMKKALSDKKKGKKGMKEDAECAHNKKGEDCPKHGKEDCTTMEGYGTGAAMIRGGGKPKKKETQDQIDKRLMLGKHSPAVKYANMKKEGVQFSEAELARIQEIVDSWSD